MKKVEIFQKVTYTGSLKLKVIFGPIFKKKIFALVNSSIKSILRNKSSQKYSFPRKKIDFFVFSCFDILQL